MRLEIREYVTRRGRRPFREWLGTLDGGTRARVQARILRFETGNLGDHKSLTHGVWEARLPFGPGYRVYFGRVGRLVLLLLVGGDKSSQRRDITRATRYWADYLTEIRNDETK